MIRHVYCLHRKINRHDDAHEIIGQSDTPISRDWRLTCWSSLSRRISSRCLAPRRQTIILRCIKRRNASRITLTEKNPILNGKNALVSGRTEFYVVRGTKRRHLEAATSAMAGTLLRGCNIANPHHQLRICRKPPFSHPARPVGHSVVLSLAHALSHSRSMLFTTLMIFYRIFMILKYIFYFFKNI